MRIYLSYSSAVDKGEGRFYRDALRRLGHEVHVIDVPGSPLGSGWAGTVTAGYPADVSLAELAALLGPPDVFLYVEPDGLIPRDIATSPCQTIGVICDTHRRLEPRIELARLFDRVFLYQRNYVRFFRDHPVGHVQWLPYGCDETFFRPGAETRDLDVAFVGQRGPAGGERDRVLNALQTRWRLNEQRQYTQAEMSAIYGRAKIVVNLPVGDDLNFRFFEALSCGALLLTKRIDNGQDEILTDGTHFVSFADEPELLRKIDYFLQHERERRRIADAGHASCVAGHTLAHRISRILENVPHGPGGAPVRATAPGQRDLAVGRFLARCGRVEALGRLARAAGNRGPFRRALVEAWLRLGWRMVRS